jgi:hypothetical protein
VIAGEVDGDGTELKMILVEKLDLHGSPVRVRMGISLIFSTASSIVKLFGFWIGGKSLNVSVHLPIIAWAAPAFTTTGLLIAGPLCSLLAIQAGDAARCALRPGG